MCKENRVDVPYPNFNFVMMFTVDIVAWSAFSLCGMFHSNVLFLRYTYTEIFFFMYFMTYLGRCLLCGIRGSSSK
jgi:hypothetical protein